MHIPLQSEMVRIMRSKYEEVKDERMTFETRMKATNCDENSMDDWREDEHMSTKA